MPNIDLFASRLNYQLKLFVSWGPDPEASITFPAEGCTMFWKEKLTNSRPTYHQRAEEIPKYTDDRLCGVRCLEEIHSRTALQYYSKWQCCSSHSTHSLYQWFVNQININLETNTCCNHFNSPHLWLAVEDDGRWFCHNQHWNLVYHAVLGKLRNEKHKRVFTLGRWSLCRIPWCSFQERRDIRPPIQDNPPLKLLFFGCYQTYVGLN